MPTLPNSKHERFAQEIAQGRSAAEAFVTAGYKAHDGNASRLRSNEKVRNRIEEITSHAAEQAGVTVKRIVDDLATIAFDTQSKNSDRIAAHTLLGKHLGMFKDKVEHSGPGGGPVEMLTVRFVKA